MHAVTKKTVSKVFPTEPNKPSLRIFNIPGLFETDKADIDRNKAEVESAFKQAPRSVVAYVFSQLNGSLEPLQVTAILELNKAFKLHPQSLLFVINQCDTKTDPQWQGELIAHIQALTAIPSINCRFIPNLKEDDTAAADRERSRLFHALLTLAPAANTQQAELNLTGDSEETKQKLAAVQAQAAQLNEQKKAGDEQYKALVAKGAQQATEFNNKINQLLRAGGKSPWRSWKGRRHVLCAVKYLLHREAFVGRKE